jgi:hypothetical protein
MTQAVYLDDDITSPRQETALLASTGYPIGFVLNAKPQEPPVQIVTASEWRYINCGHCRLG